MGLRLAEKFTTLAFDIIATNIALFTAIWLRYKSGFFPAGYDPSVSLAYYFTPAIVLTVAWFGLFFFTGLYRDWYKESRIDEFFVVARTVIIGMVFLLIITSAPQIIDFARTGDWRILFTPTKFPILFTYAGCMLVFATADRFITHTFLAFLFAKGIAENRVLIIGANDSGASLIKDLSCYPHQGYKIEGYIDNNETMTGSDYHGYRVLGSYKDIHDIVKQHKIHGLIITQVSNSADDVLKILEHCGDLRLVIYMVPSLMDVISGHLKTHQIFTTICASPKLTST